MSTEPFLSTYLRPEWAKGSAVPFADDRHPGPYDTIGDPAPAKCRHVFDDYFGECQRCGAFERDLMCKPLAVQYVRDVFSAMRILDRGR